MRIKGHLKLIALVSLPVIGISIEAAAQFKIEPSVGQSQPRAADDKTARKPRARRVPVNSALPSIGLGLTQCAGASDLCSWKRVPESDNRDGFEAPPARPSRPR